MKHGAIVEAINTGTTALAQSLPTNAADQLATLLEELARWNQRINLTAIREIPDMIAGHIMDSLAVRSFLRGQSVIDVGTGAGFPGLPLAIAEPGRRFELLDGNGKKVGFVRHVIAELGLSNVTAVKARAENYAPDDGFDTVIARALTDIPRFIELSSHLLREGGVLLALKGKYPAKELDDLPELWEHDVVELSVPGLEMHSRHLIVLKQQQDSVV